MSEKRVEPLSQKVPAVVVGALALSALACALPTQRIRKNEASLQSRDAVASTIGVRSPAQMTYVALLIDDGLVEQQQVRPGEPVVVDQALPTDKPFELTAVASTTHMQVRSVPYQVMVPQLRTEYCGTGPNGMARYCSRTHYVSQTRYRTELSTHRSEFCRSTVDIDLRDKAHLKLDVTIGGLGDCHIREVQ